MLTQFEKFRARYIFVDFILLSTVIPIFGLLFVGSIDELVKPFSFPSNILHIVVFCSICWVIIYRLRYCGVDVKQIVGSLNFNNIPWTILFIVFYGEQTLSSGVRYLEYYSVNLINPELIQSSLNTLKDGSNYSSSGFIFQIAQYFLLLIVLVVVAPVTEEFIFRGVFMHRWAVKWGAFWSVILSSLLFGAIHADIFWFSRAVGSIFIALLYIKTKNLIVPIILHGMNNAIAFVNLLFERFSPSTVESLNITHQYLWYGLINILLAIPIFIYFLKFPKATAELPYFVNSKTAELSSN
ncbi:MAG: CPBP family intramembrane glutamic endopeptidase [Cyanobacteria bacterium J06600_6]